MQAAGRLKVGESWQVAGLVFTTTTGTMLDQNNIGREFRQITPPQLPHRRCSDQRRTPGPYRTHHLGSLAGLYGLVFILV